MPATVPIPPWNAQGVLPPQEVTAPTSANRAPYLVSLSDLMLRFGTSAERVAILRGFWPIAPNSTLWAWQMVFSGSTAASWKASRSAHEIVLPTMWTW